MRVLVTGGAGFIGSQIVAALTADGHEARRPGRAAALGAPRRPRRRPTAPSGSTADVRDPAAVRGRTARSGRGLPPGRDGRPRQGLRRRARLRELQRPGHGRTAGRAWPRPGCGDLVLAGSMVVYGEGRYDCPRHGVVRPGPRGRGRPRPPAASSRPARACGAELAPGAGRRGRAGRSRATSTRRPSSPRSTWPPPGRARPAAGRSRCATTTSTARGCRATPRTPAWRRSSAPRWPGARHRGSSRTAGSGGTSSTYATSPRPTPWR